MPTVVGIRCSDGVAVAGDRRDVERGAVRSDAVDRVHAIGPVVIASPSAPGAVTQLVEVVEGAVRTAEFEGRAPLRIEPLSRELADRCESLSAACLCAAFDPEGRVSLRTVDEAGAILSDPVSAVGTGQSIAIAGLDRLDRSIPTTKGMEELRDVLDIVAERDPQTGSETETKHLLDQDSTAE